MQLRYCTCKRGSSQVKGGRRQDAVKVKGGQVKSGWRQDAVKVHVKGGKVKVGRKQDGVKAEEGKFSQGRKAQTCVIKVELGIIDE